MRLRQVGADVLEQVVAHAGELAQVTVVRQHDARVAKAKRVQARLRDGRVLAVGDAADVRDEARGSELGAQAAEVAIEVRERRRAIGERILGVERARVPGGHAEAGQVEERLHHARAVGLANEGAVGLEQHVRQRHRLTEIREHAAHRTIVYRATSRGASVKQEDVSCSDPCVGQAPPRGTCVTADRRPRGRRMLTRRTREWRAARNSAGRQTSFDRADMLALAASH